MVAVTTWPLVVTLFPASSFTRSTGCWAMACPFFAVELGDVTSESSAAGPG